jgi:hypothetical protein
MPETCKRTRGVRAVGVVGSLAIPACSGSLARSVDAKADWQRLFFSQNGCVDGA